MKIESVSKIIETVFKDLTSREKEKERFVFEILMSQFNEKEKGHIKFLSLYKKVLTLKIDSPVWMYSINFKKPKLLKIVQNEAGPDVVERINLKIGV